MSLFDYDTKMQLENIFNVADMEIRQEYHNGYVIDENDYTSNLTSHIRRIANAQLPLIVSAHTQKLPASDERRWGTDAMVVLLDTDKGQGKIALFEAKVDRQNWDYTQKSSLDSHFSTQLKRQRLAVKLGFAVWEQFYTKESVHTHSQNERNPKGASCIIHSIASSLRAPHPNTIIWTETDIELLCKIQKESNFPITMGGMIRMMCECKIGNLLSLDDIIKFFEESIDIKQILIVEGVSKGNSRLDGQLTKVILSKLKDD